MSRTLIGRPHTGPRRAQPRSSDPQDAGAASIDPRKLPIWARNRVQCVSDRTCARCAGVILRAGRGPAPRNCVACEVHIRRLRQLRAYLRSAARLATELERPAIAAAANDAIVAFDSRDER